MALPAGRYGVTKNQLLKIKKLPMNTIKLIEDLYEKYSLLGSAAFKNSTSVVTESSDLVESGAVKDIVGWKCDNSVIGNVETAASSTHAYLVGQGFICDGQFRVAKGSGIAVGEQITDNNSDVKPIADCLIKQGTFSGTTDSSGLVEIYNGNRKVLKCESSVGNRIIIPYYSQTRSKVMARCMYEDGSVIASTAVSGTSYYID